MLNSPGPDSVLGGFHSIANSADSAYCANGRFFVAFSKLGQADAEVPHGRVIHLIDTVKDCGVAEFALNIEKVDKVTLRPPAR